MSELFAEELTMKYLNIREEKTELYTINLNGFEVTNIETSENIMTRYIKNIHVYVSIIENEITKEQFKNKKINNDTFTLIYINPSLLSYHNFENILNIDINTEDNPCILQDELMSNSTLFSEGLIKINNTELSGYNKEYNMYKISNFDIDDTNNDIVCPVCEGTIDISTNNYELNCGHYVHNECRMLVDDITKKTQCKICEQNTLNKKSNVVFYKGTINNHEALLELDKMDLYTLPVNNLSRGGKRMIFSSPNLAHQLSFVFKQSMLFC